MSSNSKSHITNIWDKTLDIVREDMRRYNVVVSFLKRVCVGCQRGEKVLMNGMRGLQGTAVILALALQGCKCGEKWLIVLKKVKTY